MKIEEVIYKVLSESDDLKEIFNNNINPLTSKKQKLPALMYQVFINNINATKTGSSLYDEYILRIHIFSENYIDVINGVDIIKELLDYKEFTDDEENIIIDLIRFVSFSDVYEEKAELFNRTLDFSLYKVN